MLLRNILKLLNCAAPFHRTSSTLPSCLSSIRSLSVGKEARIIEEVNLNKAFEHLGKDVDFYQITRVSKNGEFEQYPSDTLAFIPDPYAWGKYSFSVLQKKAVKKLKKSVPIFNLIGQKWRNRPQAEIEATIGRMLTGFMPYVDLSVITLFPYLVQTGYFVLFRPGVVFSNLGSASTIKMITDRKTYVGAESNGRLYVLIKISREHASKLPISELALKFKTKSNYSSNCNDEDSD